ncbi:hypothetical protein HV560_01310 [Mannheimia pernigra]|uniref:Uncharacterized protein n=1 Tax=Mannheimia pernigra TaxID=111844 RepID=A0ABD7A604_9PAST|nr:hypothetical protein [Mannheimia pernigra]QLB41575.1 hypothetical protein HV560_01310 [Mannheimia pernigra]
MNELVARATDEALLSKYKRKKAPKYKLNKKEFDGLESVKVTPIGTFLIFNQEMDVSDFDVKGKFERMEKHGNLIAISHEKVSAPKWITVEFGGKKLVLSRSNK